MLLLAAASHCGLRALPAAAGSKPGKRRRAPLGRRQQRPVSLLAQKQDEPLERLQKVLGAAVLAAPLLLGAPAAHGAEAAAPAAEVAEQPTMRTALLAGGVSGFALFVASTLYQMQKGKPAGGDAGAAGGGAGKAPADAESAARLAELKRQMAEAGEMEARAGELQSKTSELRAALNDVMRNLEDVRRARLAAEAELARLSAAATQAAAVGLAPSAAAAQDEAMELRQRQEAEAVAQWQAADQRFQEVLGQMVEEQSSMDSEDEADALKARFLDVLDDLHAERERAAILQYKWLEEKGRGNGAPSGSTSPPPPPLRQASASPPPRQAPASPPQRQASASPSPAAAQWDQPARASPAPQQAASRSPSAMPGDVPAGQRWTDPQFAAEVLAAFPAKAVATVEEARCLMEKGRYAYLDVRSVLELEDAGRIPGAINIPLIQAQRVFNPASGKRELKEWDNELWVEQVRWRFPDLDTPLVVGDGDGGGLAVGALEVLEEEGYSNIVGLKGGFQAWTQVFDSKGARRSRSTSAAPPMRTEAAR